MEVGPEQRIGKGNNDGPLKQFGRKQQGVREAERLFLVIELPFRANRGRHLHEAFLYGNSKTGMNNKPDRFDFFRANPGDIFYQPMHNGFTGNGQKRFGCAERVWAQPLAQPGHGYNDIHNELGNGYRKIHDQVALDETFFLSASQATTR